MGGDLFLNAKERLLAEIRTRGVMKTSEVIRWGCQNYSNRADRNMRQFAKDGLVRRMPEEVKAAKFGDIREDVWEAVA